MGRAAGIPTRVIANYMIGAPHQTHSINEFYLGAELGWRRVEPQFKRPSIHEDYAVTMRIVDPIDEGQIAMNSRKLAFKGVPFFTVVEALSYEEIHSLPSEDFHHCSHCDNQSYLISDLRGTGQEIKDLFATAEQTWQRDSQSFFSGNIVQANQLIRKKALTISSLEELRSLMHSLRND